MTDLHAQMSEVALSDAGDRPGPTSVGTQRVVGVWRRATVSVSAAAIVLLTALATAPAGTPSRVHLGRQCAAAWCQYAREHGMRAYEVREAQRLVDEQVSRLTRGYQCTPPGATGSAPTQAGTSGLAEAVPLFVVVKVNGTAQVHRMSVGEAFAANSNHSSTDDVWVLRGCYRSQPTTRRASPDLAGPALR